MKRKRLIHRKSSRRQKPRVLFNASAFDVSDQAHLKPTGRSEVTTFFDPSQYDVNNEVAERKKAKATKKRIKKTDMRAATKAIGLTKSNQAVRNGEEKNASRKKTTAAGVCAKTDHQYQKCWTFATDNLTWSLKRA